MRLPVFRSGGRSWLGLILIFGIALGASSTGWAQRANRPLLPVVTTTGTGHGAYHVASCPLLHGQPTTPTDRPTAAKAGETACGVCLPDGPRRPPRLQIAKAKFAGTYRAGKALNSALDVGANMLRFQQLLQDFATEVSLVRDLRISSSEKQLLDQYESALASFAYAAKLWSDTSGPMGPELMVTFSKLLTLCGVEITKAEEIYNAALPPA